MNVIFCFVENVCKCVYDYFTGKFGLSGKKKEKNRGKLVPDIYASGAIVWLVQVIQHCIWLPS